MTIRMTVHRLFFIGLVLFGVSLGLSKSASNVLIALVSLGAFAAAAGDRGLRSEFIARLRQPLLLPMAFILGIAILGVAWTERFSDGMGIVNKMSGMVLVYLMTASLVDLLEQRDGSRQVADTLLLAYVAGVFALDVLGLLTYLGIMGNKPFSLPIAPLHVHHIWFANANAVAFYAATALLLFRREGMGSGERRSLYAFLPVSLLSMFSSLSRTAWLGLLATVVILAYLLIRNKRTFALLLAALPVAAILLYLFSPIIRGRIDQIFADITIFLSGRPDYTSIGGRFFLWKASFRMFLSSPLVGIGTGDFVPVLSRFIQSGEYPAFLADFNQPHNMYLFALATNGLVGLSALAFLFLRGLTDARRILQAPGQGRMYGALGLAVIVHYLVGGMTDSFLNIQILRYSFAFLIGICMRGSLVPSSPDARNSL